MDLYFDVLNDRVDDSSQVVGNYSLGVEMQSSFGDFYPTKFYAEHPLQVLSLRQWNVNNYHQYDPKTTPLATTTESTAPEPATGEEGEKKGDDYPQFDQDDKE